MQLKNARKQQQCLLKKAKDVHIGEKTAVLKFCCSSILNQWCSIYSSYI